MPKLQIPEAYREAIASLADLTEGQFLTLHEALRTARTTSADDVVALIQPRFPNDQDLVEAILPFYSIPEEAGVTLAQFAEDVIDAVRSEWTGRPADDAASAERQFRARLTDLINIKEFSVLAKAITVLTDYERAFKSVKVFSDLRPIFGEDVEKGVVGMGIVHNLKITFGTAEHDSQDVYFALTAADLRKFISVLERAESKAAALRKQLISSGIRQMEGE